MPQTVIKVETLGALLKAKRGREPQHALAARMGCSRVSICHYERGRNKPTAANLVKLADALAFSPEDWALVRQLLGEK
jgi:transcriptional regulator with XRE-family HTH domain